MLKRILTLALVIAFSSTTFAQTINPSRLDSLFTLLAQHDKFTGSIAISQNGHLLYTKAIGFADIATAKKATTNTRYRIGSISKMFTASLIFKAVEEKKLSLQQTLDKYFPQIENSNKITIAQLLNHSSGIHNFTNDKTYLTYFTTPKSAKEMVDIIAKGKSDFQPGTKSAYSNSNYVILSYILEQLYGQPYAKILQTKITQPIGLKNTYFGGHVKLQNNECYSYLFTDKWVKQPETDPSIPMGAGAVVSTPADLTFFIEQLFAGKIISDSAFARMKTIQNGYGMGIFEYPYLDKKCYGHTGGIDGFRSVLNYFPEEKLSIAITANGDGYPLNNILICALSSYFHQPYHLPTFTSITLSAAALDSFPGNYSSAQVPLKLAITKKDNKLFAQATGQSAFPLEATSSDSFQFEPAGVVIIFSKDRKQLTLQQGGTDYLFNRE